MASPLLAAPEYGSRQLHQTLDLIANQTPDRLYAVIPRSSDLADGFRDISFGDMSRCSNFVAGWIESRIGRSATFQTLCYIGVPDLRSVAIFFGAVKCGYKVLFPSPRNPPSTNASLLEQTECTIVIHAAEVAPVVKQLEGAKSGLQSFTSPSFDEMLEAESKPFSYEEKSFEEAKNNPIVVLHSSGSTGIPKPITMTHGSFSILDSERKLPTVPGRQNRDFSIWDFPGGGRFYHIFPYFHLAGFLSNIVNPTFTEASSPVLGPALMPPSGQLLKQIMESQQLRALYIPPAIAEQLLQEPGSLDLFKKLDFLCYTGAPFSPSAGKQLVEVTTLVSLYGSTEAFQVPQLVPSKEDWSYMEWNPNFKLEMQPSEDEEGAYEVVLFTDASTERTSALNHNVPGVNIWRTKDLFKPHPTKPTLWRYFGRRDDIIVLSNSEKFNPVPFELAVQGHPLLAGALVVGQGRVRASLLVEPKPTVQGEERASLIDRIWPRVEEANGLVPGHGRISRSNIIVAEKPFTRAGKGTVVRKLTEQTFKPDIDALYVNGIVTSQRKEPVLKATYEWQAVLDFVRSSIVSSFPPAADVGEDEDLFSFGLDSLNIADLVSRLKAGIEGHPGFSDLSWITPAAVYHHPTIRQFSIVLSDFLNKRNVPTEEAPDARATRLQELLKSFTQNFPKPCEQHSSDSVSGVTVALTGSTGSLGTSILASLLKNSSVTRIILLNRSTDAKQRQESSLKCHGITELDSSRVEFKTINLGHPKLGLSSEDYALLANSIDIFVHNAWRVDFNMSLQSFANPYLQSVRSAIDLSTASKKYARIVFVSSTSSMMAFGPRIPESVPEGFSGPTGLGYAESKSIAEKILAAANDASGTPVTILRVGQVAGSTDPKASAWPTQEWLYPVIKACRALSLAPETLMPIDWVPIDLASSTITELLLSPVKDSLQVYNIVNPKEVSWDMLVQELQSRFGPGLKTVPLKEWLQQVRKHESYAAEAPKLEPALKMVDEILKGTGPVSIDTEKAVAGSSTLKNIKAIDKNLLGIWLDQWKL